jgi:hypothetical protein
LVREDGVAVSLAVRDVSIQFPPARTYALSSDGPCALLFDGGVVCGETLVHLDLPPADSIVAGWNRVCVQSDGGIACIPGVAPGVDLSALVDVTMVGASRVCGHLADGGQRCVASDGGTDVDLGTTLASWLEDSSLSVSRIVRTFADGIVDPDLMDLNCGVPFPREDAGYVAPFLNNCCAIREDGFLRCRRWGGLTLASGIPISRERVVAGAAGSYTRGCVWTVDGRVHCRGSGVASVVPPIAPVVSVLTSSSAGLFVGADGRIDALWARGLGWPSPEVAFDEHYVALTGDLDDEVGFVLDDGRVKLPLVQTASEPLKSSAGRFGLFFDGGIIDLVNNLPVAAPAAEMISSIGSGQFCALRSGVWECPAPLGPLPGSVVQLGGRWVACGVATLGKVHCTTPLPEPYASMRFSAVSTSRSGAATLTTWDGVAYDFDGTSVRELSSPWNDFIRVDNACGLRRDGTGVCSDIGGRFPWTGR